MLNFLFGFFAICFLYGVLKVILHTSLISSILGFLGDIIGSLVCGGFTLGSICWGIIAFFQHTWVPMLFGHNAFLIGALCGMAIVIIFSTVNFVKNIFA